jgi:hypothetical protein
MNVALGAPGWTTTPDEIAATAGLLLRSVTMTPPAGAGWFNFTVPTACAPPTTLTGVRATVLIWSGATGMRGFG